ncbi:hypothetical protein TNCV_1238861 [Trichonephila clavipes]|nr:hypothetical protein TNCV_1238861 [Trichonephila clavipes]
MDVLGLLGQTSWECESKPRVCRTPSMEQNVMDTIRRNPSTSVRATAAAVGGPRSSVHGVLQREGLHPYHLQRIPPPVT